MAVQNVADIRLILDQHRDRLKALGVRRLGLFGSFVRGQQRPDSDIDVLVEFEPGQKTFNNFMKVASLLEELFQRPVELLTPESVSPYIWPHIEMEADYVSLIP